MTASTRYKLFLNAVLGMFLVVGKVEAQTYPITPEQAANRAALVDDWVDGGHRYCILNGGGINFCGCIAGGIRETPVVDILVVKALLAKDIPIANTRAVKYVEHVYRVCSHR
ncbi:hypothetical protein [Limnohabitans sp. Bal53]|uniref:hypothetical protein n=1 Tax=Limnohabitans sp. Bal53 TaxID=1977910 RepID=UPI0011B25C90|nr:hypothetical protein [Limnohabitans sp. Bal53]